MTSQWHTHTHRLEITLALQKTASLSTSANFCECCGSCMHQVLPELTSPILHRPAQRLGTLRTSLAAAGGAGAGCTGCAVCTGCGGCIGCTGCACARNARNTVAVISGMRGSQHTHARKEIHSLSLSLSLSLATSVALRGFRPQELP